MRCRTRPLLAALSVTVVALVAGCSAAADGASDSPPPGTVSTPTTPSGGPTASGPVATPGTIKNVVLVLADDLEWPLWNDIPRLKALEAEGTTFTNYVVSDSLCCPSRTTIFRGQYVHNHHVVSNDQASGGGWPVFRDQGYPKDCLPVWLHKAGVRTGLVGKYLNQFPHRRGDLAIAHQGWDDFVVPTSHRAEYRGYDYRLDDNGTIDAHGSAPTDFLNDVLTSKATDFIGTAGDHFFLELATFTPHLPAPVAPRNLGTHTGERAPRDPAWDTAVTNAPHWLAGLPPFTAATAAHLDRTWVRRARSAESVADSVDAVRAALAASGHTDDTLLLVTSDNGFHTGSYRLHRGKRTAFDDDTVVPMVAIGPGVAAGRTVPQMTSETDLAPTISEELGAGHPDWVDGRSWKDLLAGPVDHWRSGVLSESLGTTLPGDPDFQLIAPPSFTALRTERWLYVETPGQRSELYDRLNDPYELHNIIGTAPRQTLAALHRQLVAMQRCAGPTCRVADALPGTA